MCACARGRAGCAGAAPRGEGVKFFVFRPLFRPALVFRLPHFFFARFLLPCAPPHVCCPQYTHGSQNRIHSFPVWSSFCFRIIILLSYIVGEYAVNTWSVLSFIESLCLELLAAVEKYHGFPFLFFFILSYLDCCFNCIRMITGGTPTPLCDNNFQSVENRRNRPLNILLMIHTMHEKLIIFFE